MEIKKQVVIKAKINETTVKLVADESASLGCLWDAVVQFQGLIAQQINDAQQKCLEEKGSSNEAEPEVCQESCDQASEG